MPGPVETPREPVLDLHLGIARSFLSLFLCCYFRQNGVQKTTLQQRSPRVGDWGAARPIPTLPHQAASLYSRKYRKQLEASKCLSLLLQQCDTTYLLVLFQPDFPLCGKNYSYRIWAWVQAATVQSFSSLPHLALFMICSVVPSFCLFCMSPLFYLSVSILSLPPLQ